MSRKARGVEAYAALYSLGKSGIATLVEQSCSQARLFEKGLQDAGYHILNDVVLNQVLVDFGKNTNKTIEAIQRDRTCWAGGTTWNGKDAMRISVSSWATTDEDVQRSLDAMIRVAGKYA
jgi:glutamate/tyrosine decarboxylase-like PLP-dependent enzyme